MNDQLQQALLSILNGTIDAVKTGVTFLQAQLPDVIQQLLMWHAVRSGVFFTQYLVLAVVCVLLAIRCGRRAFAEKYDTYFPLYFFGGIATVAGTLTFSGLLIHELAWLQIIVAPKIYLIEYAASLVKKGCP